jgi:hypothetical protein
MSDDTLLDESEIDGFKSEVMALLREREDQLTCALFFAERTKNYCGKNTRTIIRKQLLDSIKGIGHE